MTRQSHPGWLLDMSSVKPDRRRRQAVGVQRFFLLPQADPFCPPPRSWVSTGRSGIGAVSPFVTGLAKVGNPPNSAGPAGPGERTAGSDPLRPFTSVDGDDR